MRKKDHKTINITMDELRKGFSLLGKIHGPCVTIFGSAIAKSDHPHYDKAYQLAKKLGNLGFNIITGGGSGIMEACNKGAKESRSKSIGLNIKLPDEQLPNSYIDVCLTFKHFYARKVCLVKYASAVIVFGGGMGSRDELYEVLTLIQTGKMDRIPVILYDTKFWKFLLLDLKQCCKYKFLREKDLEVLKITDSIEEIVEDLKKLKNEKQVKSKSKKV